MDSANSGSMQSSSGGDDQEYDSRGESNISSFLNPSPHNNNNFTPISPPHPSFLAQQTTPFFNYPTQYNNNDLIWSKPLRSDDQQNYTNSNYGSNLTPSPQAPLTGPSTSGARLSADAKGPASRAKNPKKRTRASRRAPTTVLTTDTTNFRQMVQEFTGIPAAPFSCSPYSRRLDLFTAASALRPGGHFDNLGPIYPVRPSAHKIFNTAMVDAIAPTTNIGSTSDDLLNPPLMDLGNLDDFVNNNDNGRRWRSGETVGNNDGIQENINSSDSQNIGGYNLNLAEKGVENNNNAVNEGTISSWIRSSD